MIPSFLLAELNKLVPDPRRSDIEPGAEIEALGLDALDRLTLGMAIGDAEVEGWRTVADIVASAVRRDGYGRLRPEGCGGAL